MSPLARQKNIRIERRIDPALVHVRLDRQKFLQVLYNLMSNAVKFTDDGGSVVLTAASHGDGQLRIDVRDTGVGIRPQDIGRLFTEFQQLDSSPTRRYQGTGLGLALTRKIVEFQGGSISVASEPGVGSTFTVMLPRQVQP